MSAIELARQIVATKLERQEPLRAEFLKLGVGDRLRCIAEITRCKTAKRGEQYATLG